MLLIFHAFLLFLAVIPAAAQETNSGAVRTVEECLQARRDGEFGRTGFRDCKQAADAANITSQEAIIVEQNQILAAQNTELAKIGLRLDDQNRILDNQRRELAHLIDINGQLVIRRQQLQLETAELDASTAELDADSEAKLLEAQTILQKLVKQ